MYISRNTKPLISNKDKNELDNVRKIRAYDVIIISLNKHLNVKGRAP
jgi:hypothetical protein